MVSFFFPEESFANTAYFVMNITLSDDSVTCCKISYLVKHLLFVFFFFPDLDLHSCQVSMIQCHNIQIFGSQLLLIFISIFKGITMNKCAQL